MVLAQAQLLNAHDNLLFIFSLSFALQMKRFNFLTSLNTFSFITALLSVGYHLLFIAVEVFLLNDWHLKYLTRWPNLKYFLHMEKLTFDLDVQRYGTLSGEGQSLVHNKDALGKAKSYLVKNYHLITITKKVLCMAIVFAFAQRPKWSLALLLVLHILFLAWQRWLRAYKFRVQSLVLCINQVIYITIVALILTNEYQLSSMMGISSAEEAEKVLAAFKRIGLAIYNLILIYIFLNIIYFVYKMLAFLFQSVTEYFEKRQKAKLLALEI